MVRRLLHELLGQVLANGSRLVLEGGNFSAVSRPVRAIRMGALNASSY